MSNPTTTWVDAKDIDLNGYYLAARPEGLVVIQLEGCDDSFVCVYST